MSDWSGEKYKYLTVLANTVRVKIERGNDEYVEHFHIRNFASVACAIQAALAWRDSKHLEVYGVPVTEKVFQVKRRKERQALVDPKTGLPLPSLTAGLSYGFSRGKLTYVVVSVQVNGRPSRHRIPIKDQNLVDVVRRAEQLRLDLLKKHVRL